MSSFLTLHVWCWRAWRMCSGTQRFGTCAGTVEGSFHANRIGEGARITTCARALEGSFHANRSQKFAEGVPATMQVRQSPSINQVTKHAEIPQTHYVDKAVDMPVAMQRQVPQFRAVLKTG